MPATQSNSVISWTKAVAIVGAALGAWLAMQHEEARRDVEFDAAELKQLASTVEPDDIVIYTTTECPYCAEAISWMNDHGFDFTECDAQLLTKCANELDSFGGDGVPYLIVRGEHLGAGFDSEEFVATLRRTQSTATGNPI